VETLASRMAEKAEKKRPMAEQPYWHPIARHIDGMVEGIRSNWRLCRKPGPNPTSLMIIQSTMSRTHLPPGARISGSSRSNCEASRQCNSPRNLSPSSPACRARWLAFAKSTVACSPWPRSWTKARLRSSSLKVTSSQGWKRYCGWPMGKTP
jgi:hypothetical protein